MQAPHRVLVYWIWLQYEGGERSAVRWCRSSLKVGREGRGLGSLVMRGCEVKEVFVRSSF